LETVAQLLRESRRRTISQSGVETALQEHEGILATIAAHDPAAARQAMLTHMRLIERDLKESLRPGGTP
jgi:DNA-binding GntR family transcriptional regulator